MPPSGEYEVENAVAVVGMAGRFPGADSIDEFWQNLRDGRESIERFTPDELRGSGVPPHLVDDPSYVPARGLLRDPEGFDAAFFGVGPRDAALMDPQHRLFLETCWHALENAGYPPAGIERPVGVWGGMSTGMENDTYLHALLGGPRALPEEDRVRALIGNENDYLTTRVSYKLNLRGPSVNLQTACSTSLVAVAQAYQSLSTFECDMALAGGVSVSYPQKAGYVHQEGGIGSPDGHCRPFDEEARGTVFSNGVGVVVLKRLEDALADGDTIWALVRGAATNNDGAAKVSFAAPSVEGQAEVIARAQAVAGVHPRDVSYVETHGTGTPIGDPIEVAGLTQAFRRRTDDSGFCALGSVKSNFGHLDSAAGIAGFIKTVLCLHHRMLVPTVHFRRPSSRIPWEDTPFFVNGETRPWESDGRPRRAGVSAFGIGGTNAHVVLEEAPSPDVAGRGGEPGPQVLPLSARTATALRAGIERLASHLDGSGELCMADVAFTLQEGRQHFRHRAALVAPGRAEAAALLRDFDRTRIVVAEADEQPGDYVFLFPGGGAQYVGMGRGLYRAFPSFREEVDRGLALAKEQEGLDLRPVWFPEGDDAVAAAEERFQRPSLQLPALFILEMALARLLVRWGFQPSALVGHSLGENVAACLAGVLDYEAGLGLVALRGRLFDTAEPGGMLSVSASADRVRRHLGSALDLAAVNAPEQCTVSGPRRELEELQGVLDGEGVDAQFVPIDIAAHSALVEPLLEPFEAYLRSVELRPPAIPFLSNLTGTWITDAQATDPAYWAAHLRGTVRFADDVRTVLDDRRPFFLEVGPGRILSSLVKLCQPSAAARVAPTMRHPREEAEDAEALLGAVARAWVQGNEVAWDRIRGSAPVRRIPLPGYPFERTPFLAGSGVGEAGEGGARSAPVREIQASGASPEREAAPSPQPPPPAASAPAAAAPPSAAGADALRDALELQARAADALVALLEGGAAPPGGAAAPSTTEEAPASGTPVRAAPESAPEAGGPPASTVDADREAAPSGGAAGEAGDGPPASAPAAGGGAGSAREEAAPGPAAAGDDPPSPTSSGRSALDAWGEIPATAPPEERESFWTRYLSRPLPPLDLMTDGPRSAEAGSRRGRVARDVPARLSERAAALGREEGASLPAVLLAAWAATLGRAAGQEELTVGVEISGAGAGVASGTDGSGILPVRLALEPDVPFRALVRRVEGSVRELAAHGIPAPERLAARPGTAEGTDPGPAARTVLRIGGPPPGRPTTVAAGTDVDLHVGESGPGLRIAGDYASALFREGTVAELLDHLLAVLEAGLDAPDAELRSLPPAAPGVMERIAGWNATDVPLPEVAGLAGWLASAWEEHAGRPAVVGGGERLTYGELSERAHRLARHLAGLGVGPGSLVGLCLERTADMVVAAVAVWRTGAGYVPLDPTYPTSRLDLMARRAGLEHVVSLEPLQERIPGFGGRWVLLDRDADRISDEAATPLEVEEDLSRPAYVIFTSGSTGEPKGVQVPGRCVVNFLESMRRRPGFSPEDTLLAVTTLSFDISVLELFLPLLAGGTVVVASAEEAMDGQALAELMVRHGVTVMQATPSTWRILLESGWEGRPELRVLCGGEPFPRELVGRLLPRVGEVWNMYGPTETTVWSTVARLTDPEAPVVIGTPIENTYCHVLDAAGRPVAPGVPGELHIGGLGVADGYVGRPEETRARFLPDPFTGEGRMYRTGDVVRWRRDGRLEHLRRQDQQVKLRGFRIELGEVETALAERPQVRAAVVTLTRVGDSDELVGYAVAPADGWDERGLREELATRLPGYMIPRFLVRLDELPRTDNNKIDRKALPAPTSAGPPPADPPTAAAEPGSEAEAYLVGVWRSVLELERISPEDNFFDLGGHSLLAVRLMGQIRKERGVEVPLRALITGSLGGIARTYLSDGAGAPAPVGGEGSPDDERDGRISRVLGSVRDWMTR